MIHLRMLEALFFFFRHPGPRGASARDQVSSHPFPAKSGNESAKRLQIIVAKLISIDQIVYYIYYIYVCVSHSSHFHDDSGNCHVISCPHIQS